MAQKHIDMNQANQIQQLSADGVAIKRLSGAPVSAAKQLESTFVKWKPAIIRQVTVSPPLPDNELAAIIYNKDSSPFWQQRFVALIKQFEEKKDILHKTKTYYDWICSPCLNSVL